MIKLRSHDTRTFCGDSDLLLVVPTLGQLSRSVEPVCRLMLSCPTHCECCTGEGIKSNVKVRRLRTCHLHQINQDARAQAPEYSDAFLVQTIYQTDCVLCLQRINFQARPIAHKRQFSKRRVEQMRRYISHLP